MSFDIDDCDGPTKKDLLSIYQCAKCSGRVRKEDYKCSSCGALFSESDHKKMRDQFEYGLNVSFKWPVVVIIVASLVLLALMYCQNGFNISNIPS